MQTLQNPVIVSCAISREMREALEAACAVESATLSEFLRSALKRAIRASGVKVEPRRKPTIPSVEEVSAAA